MPSIPHALHSKDTSAIRLHWSHRSWATRPKIGSMPTVHMNIVYRLFKFSSIQQNVQCMQWRGQTCPVWMGRPGGSNLSVCAVTCQTCRLIFGFPNLGPALWENESFANNSNSLYIFTRHVQYDGHDQRHSSCNDIRKQQDTIVAYGHMDRSRLNEQLDRRTGACSALLTQVSHFPLLSARTSETSLGHPLHVA